MVIEEDAIGAWLRQRSQHARTILKRGTSACRQLETLRSARKSGADERRSLYAGGGYAGSVETKPQTCRKANRSRLKRRQALRSLRQLICRKGPCGAPRPSLYPAALPRGGAARQLAPYKYALPAGEFRFIAMIETVGAGWSSPVARQAHNLKVRGSNPLPAPNFYFL